MVIIGVLLAIFGLIMVVLRPHLTEENVFEDGRRVSRKAPAFLLMFSRNFSALIMALGIVVFMLPYLMFWAEPGYQYFLVYPTGRTDAVMSEGIKWRGFAKITPWQKFVDVKVVQPGDDVEEIEGAMDPIPIRFIDQVTAKAYVSTRFQLPTNKESFIEMAIKFRSMENMVQNTLIPTVREQANNTGYMFAAQDYISGEAQNFRQTLDEQLKMGAYAVEKREYKDTVYSDEASRKIKEVKTSYEVRKVMANGLPKRIPHEITENNIIVSQVIVDDVDLEETFRKRLEAQRDESAKRQLEQQKIETAKAAQSRIIAEGERDKAAERVTQEKEQVKALIEIETRLKKESTNRQLAEIALKTERLKAEAEKVKADAESYKNKKLVSAGLTPQERAEWEYKTAVGVAAEIAKIQFPQTMITGGDGKGNKTPLESLIGAAMAKQLTDGNTKRK